MNSESSTNSVTGPVLSPAAVLRRLPASPGAIATVSSGRDAIRDIMSGGDDRLLMVVGPCSIHDPDEAVEYAWRLGRLSGAVSDRLLVVMRVYLEKPRTCGGWRGLLSDPRLDGSDDMAGGIAIGRALMLAVTDIGLPVATEFVDPLAAHYLADLVAWAAVGARTVESPVHRRLAGGLPMPVGVKNAPDGRVQAAVNAMLSIGRPHAHLDIGESGQACIRRSRGNPDTHLVLRGGSNGPNADPASIRNAVDRLSANGLCRGVMVDCGHMNGNKSPDRQAAVCESVAGMRAGGMTAILGMMLESNLREGSQPIPDDPAILRYGVSVTDPCIGWEKTEALLRRVHAIMGNRKTTGRETNARIPMLESAV